MIQILDLQINNLASLAEGLTRSGFEDIKISEELLANPQQDTLVIPGNGNFGRASNFLDRDNLRDKILDFYEKDGKIIGICLGMQLFAEFSEEAESARGLGLIEGKVRKFPKSISRIPHIGWNEIYPVKERNTLNLNCGLDVYFCHSYYFDVFKSENIYATTQYENFEFASMVVKKSLIGMQYHPEKSSNVGKEVLIKIKEWLDVKV
jgi:glutamine amidotransferase